MRDVSCRKASAATRAMGRYWGGGGCFAIVLVSALTSLSLSSCFYFLLGKESGGSIVVTVEQSMGESVRK